MIYSAPKYSTKSLAASLTGLSTVQDFVRDYKGPKLSIVVVGGGNFLADILKFPGASAIVEAVYQPYSEPAVRAFCGVDEFPAVSAERVKRLEYCTPYGEGKVVAITAALTTTRYRKGDNHAWYMIAGMKEPEHIVLEKLSEEKYNALSYEDILTYRLSEDAQITKIVLDKVMELHGTKSP